MEVSASFMHEFISPPLLFQHDVHPKLCIPNPDMLYLTISKKKPQFSAGMRGGAIRYTFLFTTAQRKGQEKEGREARPASSRPLLFPRTQSGEAQGTAGAGEQHGSGKESRATERDPPLTTNLGRNGKIEETRVGVEDTLRLQRSVLSQPASTFT